MASLTEIFRDPKRCGVFRYNGEFGSVERAAKGANLSLHKLDLSGAHGKDDLLATFAKGLKFPNYFGKNWDALDECLSDLEWLDAPGWVLIVTGAQRFAAKDSDSLTTTLEVLQSAAEYWRAENKPFWAIVAGDNRTKELAELESLAEK